MEGKGIVFVVSAPSGGGKSTILSAVLKDDPSLRCSVSATTRAPRKGEVNGREYVFIDRREFERWIAEGKLIEWAEVHGNLYGTPVHSLDSLLGSGHDIILELDVQGMRSIRRLRDDAVTIFIAPPSKEALRERITKRGGLNAPEIETRMRTAEEELKHQGEYDYVIVNGELDEAIRQFKEIVAATRSKRQTTARKGAQNG